MTVPQLAVVSRKDLPATLTVTQRNVAVVADVRSVREGGHDVLAVRAEEAALDRKIEFLRPLVVHRDVLQGARDWMQQAAEHRMVPAVLAVVV